MKKRRSSVANPTVNRQTRAQTEGGRRHPFRTSTDSKTARWRSHRDSRPIRRTPTSEIGLAWLTASNRRYSWIAGESVVECQRGLKELAAALRLRLYESHF